MQRGVISLLLVIAAAVGAAFMWRSPDPPESEEGEPSIPQNEKATSSTSEQSVTETETESPPAPHTVSLPAFMERTFNGRGLTVGRVLAQTASYAQYFITYKSGDLTISGTMYVPKGNGPFPVLILNHGYIDPAIYTNGRGLRREEAYLASRGYVVIHPDYRNHAQSDKDPDTDLQLRQGYAEDVVNAVYAVRAAALPYLDKERLGLMGHSMGGGIVQTILVAQPDLVKAAALYAPVSADARDNFQRWTIRRPELAARIAAAYGTPDANPAFWQHISPRTFFERIRIPVMLHHGTNDASVPFEWSERTVAALEEAGKTVTFHRYDGEHHEFGPQWTLFMERTAEFFDEHLKGRQPSAVSEGSCRMEHHVLWSPRYSCPNSGRIG